MNDQLRNNIAKWVGISSCVALVALWLAVIAVKQAQYSPHQALPQGAFALGNWVVDTVDVKMIALAILGVLAVLSRRPLLVLLVFLLMFIPVGLYSLGVPGWAKLVGVATLLFASSSFWMLAKQHRKYSYPKGRGEKR